MVAAVVLAAGVSTRMGSPKCVLPYGSATMIEAVVGAANAAGLDPVVVVTGFDEEVVSGAVGGSARVVHNPRAGSGNLSSLLVGLDAVGDVAAAIVMLADMPEVDSGVVSALARGIVRSKNLGGWVEYTDGRGHPIALGRATFDDVLTLRGSKPLWPFLSSLHDGDRFVLRVDSLRPIDVNTPEDYERVTRGDQQNRTRHVG